GVLAVQPVGLDVGDEELAAVGVRAGVGHRQHPALVLHAVAGLVLEPVARAAAARALGAAALDHEVRDHPVETEAVVEAAPGQVHEVGHGQGGLVGVQLDLDRATVGVEDGVQGHGMPRWSGMPGGYAGWSGGFNRPPADAFAAPQQGILSGSLHFMVAPCSTGSGAPCPFPSCPSNASATSPSSPTSTTARPPSSTSCSSSPAPWTNAPWSPIASWTATTSRRNAASPSSRRTPRSAGPTRRRARCGASTSSTPPATPTSAARSSACCRWSPRCWCWSTRW